MRGLVVVVMVMVAPKLASAQDAPGGGAPAESPPVAQPLPPAPAAVPERHGLFGGGGLFGGNISCDGASCGSFSKGGGAAGFVGFMLSGKLGILLDVWGMTARDSTGTTNVTLTFVTGTINARYYLAPAFWIQGGVGNGHADVHVSIFQARGDDVPVGLLAAGFEIVRHRSWALDVALKLAQGTSTSSTAASGDATTGRMVGVGADLTFF